MKKLFAPFRSFSRQRSEQLRKRTARFEQLEDRTLLSVSQAEYADIRASYEEFELPESMSAVNVLEITADELSASKIQEKIELAEISSGDDLIVIRTTSGVHSVDYTSNADELHILLNSADKGKLTIVAYGDSSLTLNAHGVSRAISIESGASVNLGNFTLTGGDSALSSAMAGYGGGLYNAGTLTASKLTVTENVSSYNGGGIFNSGTLRLRDVQITDNTASAAYRANGGGIYTSGKVTAENLLIAGNEAVGSSSCGGGVYVWNGKFEAVGATVTDNGAVTGGGVYLYGSSSLRYALTLSNSIFALNEADSGSDIFRYNTKGTVTGNAVLTEWTGWDASTALLQYNASLPLFTSAETGLYTLAKDSQAIDKGINSFTSAARDLAGKTRIVNGIVDLGAYEYQNNEKPDITNVSVEGWRGVYDGSAHTVTVTDPSAATDSILYRYAGQVSADPPTFTEVGTYTVSVTVSRAGYNDWTGSADVAILPAGIVVTTNRDVVDADDGVTSLREAIVLAESETSESNVIVFSQDVFTGGDANVISLTLGELAVTKSVVIDASALGEFVTVSGAGESRVFRITGSETEADFTALVITGGYNSESVGGGVFVESGALTLNRCVVTENSAVSGNGGGVYVNDGTLTAVNTEISANKAGIGAGIYVAGGDFNSVNCTIAANSAQRYGGGVANWGKISLTNSIVSQNYGKLNNADWFGLAVDSESSSSANIVGFDAKFAVNPIFDDEGNITNSDSYNLSLSSSSWGIDRGQNNAAAGTIDLAGNARVCRGWKSESMIDLGAYEYQEAFTRSVEAPFTTVTTLLDLVDDTDGLISLREAILYADAGSTILFRDELAGGTITLANASLMISKALTIDASALEGGMILDGNSKSSIFVTDGGDAGIELKGMTITGGYSYDGGGILNSGRLTLTDSAVNEGNSEYGAGIFNYAGDLTLNRVSFNKNRNASAVYTYYGKLNADGCTFTENSAARGGAFYVSGGTASIANTVMDGNSANYGGGIQNNGGVIAITGSTITNSGSYYGGAICNYGTVSISDSVISKNNAYYNGGGIYNCQGSVTAVNVLMTGNTGGYGGALCVDESSFTAVNCTITQNDSNYGGGIFAYGAESETESSKLYSVTLDNTIVVGNTSGGGGNDIYPYNELGAINGVRSLSSFTGWTNAEMGGNYVYDSARRLFRDAENGDYRLASGAQALDAGSNIFVSSIPTDLDGKPRIVNEIVDLGCYEFQRELETASAVVTTELDVVDPFDGLISLREAIDYITEGAVTADTVTFDSYLQGKRISLNSELGALRITKALSIDASDLRGGMTVSGGGRTRVFQVEAGSTFDPVTLTSLHITGGYAQAGAGVWNDGVLALENCLIAGNMTETYGGGIWNKGALTVSNSTITDNAAGTDGAGVWSESGTQAYHFETTFRNSIVVRNIQTVGYTASDIGYAGEDGELYAFNTVSSFTDWMNKEDPDSHNYAYDASLPLFADASTGNYRLADNSQAVDAGANEYFTRTTDLDKNARVVNGTIDLGAYEYLYNADPGDTLALAAAVTFTDASYTNHEKIGNGLYGDKDVDMYAVTINTDDLTRIFGITVTTPEGYTGLDTLIRVFDAEGKELGNSGTAPVLTWTPEKTGTYYFAVSALANNAYDPASTDERVSGATGDYLIGFSYVERNPITGAVLSTLSPAAGAVVAVTVEPADATVNYQWVRGTTPDNLEPIEGAVTPYYEVSGSDAGYYIGVRVSGYGTYVGTTTAMAETAVPEYEKNLVVDTLLDISDPNDGLTSLREAIAYAETGDTITFADSLNGGTISLAGYALTISKLFDIDASSLSDGIAISANGEHRVLMVTAGELGMPVTLTNLTISDGSAMYGGGVYVSGYLTLADSAITDCAAYEGGALFIERVWNSETQVSSGSVKLLRSSIEDCSATQGGGGVWNQGGIAAFDYSVIRGCTAPIGGGIYNYYGAVSTTDALVADNSASHYGGGICNDMGTIYFVGSTIAGNAAAYGGGLYNYASEGYTYTVEFWNTVAAGNAATQAGVDVFNEGEGNLLAYTAMSSFTDWTNKDAGTVWYEYDPAKPLYNGAGAGDYSLAKDSQIIDIGSNDYAKHASDLAGNPRISNGIVDIGAYEYQFDTPKTELESVSLSYETLDVGSVITASVLPAEAAESGNVVWQWYRGETAETMSLIEGADLSSYIVSDADAGCYLKVTASGTGSYTGEVAAVTEGQVPVVIDPLVVTTAEDVIDLTDELVSLREAIMLAEDGAVITFSDALVGSSIVLSADLGALTISKSLTIDASSLCNPVTLSPRLTVNANAKTGESRRVFEINGTASNPVNVTIVGLTITGGRAEATVSGEENAQADGGGILARNTNLTIDRCVITKNVARSQTDNGNAFATGGGICLTGGSLSLSNSTVTANNLYAYTLTGAAETLGGGIRADGVVTVYKSTISSHYASAGAGIYLESGKLTVADSAVTANVAKIMSDADDNVAAFGAGIYAVAGEVVVRSSSITNNTISASSISGTADAHGGGLYLESATLLMEDVRLTGNSVSAETGESTAIAVGGGVYSRSSVTLINVLAAENTASAEAVSAEAAGGGFGIFGGTLTVISSTVTNNDAFASSAGIVTEAGGGIYLFAGSAVLKNTVLVENTGSDGADIFCRTGVTADAYNTISSYSEWSNVAAGAVNYVYDPLKPMFESEGSYTLAEGSQAIDLGDNSYEFYADGTAITLDLAGYKRIVGGIVDLGAYEYQTGELTQLDVPTDLTADSLGGGAVLTVWNSVSGASGYELDWSIDGGSWKTKETSAAWFTVSDLPDGSTVQFKVRAIGDGFVYSDSDFSPVVEITISQQTELPVPTGLAVESAGADSLTASWNAVAGASGYELAWSIGSGVWQTRETADVSLTIDGFDYGSQPIFKVRALGDGVQYADSVYSETVQKWVCPMDINGDGEIGGLDRTYFAKAWLSSEGDENWDVRCDFDGDGEITGKDRTYLSTNWMKEMGDDDIVYPPKRADLVDTAFADLLDDLAEDLSVF